MMEEAEKVKSRLEPFGYACLISEDPDVIEVSCSPKPEAFNRDKINRMEFLFPKRENLVNIEIIAPLEYAIRPDEINRIVQAWFKGQTHNYEAHLVGVEFRDHARESAHAIAADIIRERRKPLVLPRRSVLV